MKTFSLFVAALAVVQTHLHAQFPTITKQPASQALWIYGNVTFTVGVSGTGPLTYQWQLNGTNLSGGIITTVAGNGTQSYSGDGAAATNAGLYLPASVAFDASGNLFIADTYNNRIRKMDTNGIIMTVAGNGIGDYSGDGGIATNASLNYPFGITVDTPGNLFIADTYNHCIRKVDTNGIITTIAGNGTNGYSGDGENATNATLALPAGVAFDASGNLFIGDFDDNVIRELSTNGIITTVVGDGIGGYSGDGGAATNARLTNPDGVTFDTTGNLFIADFNNNVIRKVNTNGIITTVAGGGNVGFPTYGDGGPATNVVLYTPAGVAFDTYGNLFIAELNNSAIREMNTNGVIKIVAGNGFAGYSGDGGIATSAKLCGAHGVALNASNILFIADFNNNRIRKVTAQGPTLALDFVTAANAGKYQVVVTGPGGSITSSAADLFVTASPLIYQTAFDSGAHITLSSVSQPGSTNIMFSATNLIPPVIWQPTSTNVADAEGDWQFTDTNAAVYQMKFYRFLTQ